MKRQNHKLNKKFVQTRKFHHRKSFISPEIIVSIVIFLSFGAIILGIILLSSATVSATISTAKNDISVKVSGYCSVSNENHTYNKDIGTGSFAEIGGGNVFDIYCNDEEGYVVYAVGNGKGESGEVTEGVTDLIGSNTNNVIHTGINQGGDESGWSFKLSNATPGMVIEDDFSNNSLIPSTRTKVVSRPAGTAAASGDNFTATYSAYISTSQEPDTYSGGVKYILFHPSNINPDGTEPTPCDNSGTLYDSRDGNTYTIAKLADGKCWMTQNLRIAGKELTPDDSDVKSNFNLPASVDKPNRYNLYDQSFVHVDGTYGGYYTWFAATAGEGTQSFSSGDTKQSICPKGWRLPTQLEFQALVAAYSNNASGQLLKDPIHNFKLGGLYNSGSLLGGGSYGYYWSSTVYPSNTGYAYNMGLASTSAHPSYYGDKYCLMSVRCVSRE